MNTSAEWADSILMARFVLNRAARAGLDPDALARLAGVPNWREGGEDTRVANRLCVRLWELLEQQTGDAEIALRSADESTPGELGLLEYLFLSADTLGEALIACIRYCGCLTTSYSLLIGAHDAEQVSFELLTVTEECRGRELLVHSAFALLISRSRWATRNHVDPVRITLRQSAPAELGAFRELFGTGAIEFGAASDAITFHTRDLALPMKTADPDLAAVLTGYAAAMPAPLRFMVTWAERLAAALDAALDENTATLEVVARRLHTSPRSLQRRLAEAGTTWRRELDQARRRRLEEATHLPRAQQAELLGYADPAALRRAAQRWKLSDST